MINELFCFETVGSLFEFFPSRGVHGNSVDTEQRNLSENQRVTAVYRSICFRPVPSQQTRELKQPRRQRQQERHKSTYLVMMNNSSFARFARAFFIFGHFAVVLVLCTT